ncbi:D-alanyl-D-alanine carboxypeptidase family protein [Methylobacterium sp. NEAU 140]|uniref:D-alanyl-D-alanine carboxypeptidase family protein n=1 Tax=Methylobacterium sp. NEAU 140 TaxID=3064945 RepID=UPI002732488B|nr:D-alanyl-D-alanine carboxypeptidase family protein [Methylobacterium sp. NEAU 140]MDP4025102.1 D-alanyl-D-alanine carboxypeptidase family protein [Methylobacterium sp. NEAU 140]
MSSSLFRRVTVGLAALTGLLGASVAGIRAAEAVTVPILVVDVDSGKVIYSQAPTDPWYPASITKLMTTYVALDLVRQGRASMDTMITVSAGAAAEPPSKMGFRPGTQLTLDNALKIIMVKSANDVAYAIGESLGGSVEGFSDMMNETARRIGMQDSRWYNANGLPDPRQWTSARDMAVLARALIRDFPGNHDLFSISAIQFGKAVMANHNGLLGRYPGTDGMKTGFICSGGFNVVASATRGGRRVVTVIMGQPSPRERDVKAADLFDYAFAQGAGWTSPTLDALPASAVAAPPDMRPYVCGGKKPPAIDDGAGALTAAGSAAQLIGGAAANSPALALAAFSSPALRARSLPPRAPLQPVAVWIGRDPADGQRQLEAQENAAKTAALTARAAKLEAAKAKREALLAQRAAAKEAAKDAAKQAQAAKVAEKAAAKPASKTAAKAPHAGLPRTASAYTAVETPGMPEAKPGKGLAKPAAKTAQAAAQKAAPKAAAKPAANPAAKPAAKSATRKAQPADADE